MIEPLDADNSRERTEIWYGMDNINSRSLQILLSMQSKYDLCIGKEGPYILLSIEQLRNAYIRLKKRGVKIRIITEINKNNISYCKELTKIYGAEIRHFEVKGNFTIADRKHYGATPTVQEKPPSTPQLIYSNVKSFVEQQQFFFDMLWNKSIPAEQKITELEEGIIPLFIETIADPIKTQDLYLNLIKSAKTEVMLMIPTTSALKRQDDIGILKLVKESAISNKKLNIRILTPLDTSVENKVKTTLLLPSSYVQLRNIETPSTTRSTVIIIDRRESLVIEVKDDSEETFVDAIGFATYSNSRSTVLSYVSIFESFWLQTEMYKKVKETEQMQKEFINIAAHELRGPIQPILGLTEVLRNKAADKEQRELLDAVFRSAKKLKQLTEDILDVTRIESQSLSLRKERFNLNEMILNTIADSRNQIKRDYKDTIKLQLASKEEIYIDADRNRIYQVISNLLTNAIKFTSEEGTVITTMEKKDNNAIVSVKDSGTGIDAEILPRLFTKFTTKSQTGGTGLGLFISKSIVEAHGGRIWAENNGNGKGATFHFSLPAATITRGETKVSAFM